MPYKDREKYLTSQRGYYQKDKAAYRWRVIKNKYGLTREQFFDLLDAQDGKCALCSKEFLSIVGNNLHIDHCHETDKVRGLLCLQCNTGLGMFGDNLAGLKKAIAYLER